MALTRLRRPDDDTHPPSDEAGQSRQTYVREPSARDLLADPDDHVHE